MTAGNSFIYSDLGDENKDRAKFLKSIGEYFEDAFQYKPVVDFARLDRFCQQIAISVRPAEPPEFLSGFPHLDGFSQASVFKKLANFVVLFCENSPIQGIWGEDGQVYTLGDAFCRNYENTCYAVCKALALLKDVEISRPAPEPSVKLVNPVTLSQHSFDALAEILQDYHMRPEEDEAVYGSLDAIKLRRRSVRRYKYWAVLFEQIAYRSNPDARYDDDALGTES
jgi:hypothetical protein